MRPCIALSSAASLYRWGGAARQPAGRRQSGSHRLIAIFVKVGTTARMDKAAMALATVPALRLLCEWLEKTIKNTGRRCWGIR